MYRIQPRYVQHQPTIDALPRLASIDLTDRVTDVLAASQGAESRYEMLLKSSGGVIDVYILENKEPPPPPELDVYDGADYIEYGHLDESAMTLVVPAGVSMDYFLGTYEQGEGIADFFDSAPSFSLEPLNDE
jgi:hypothetical protein